MLRGDPQMVFHPMPQGRHSRHRPEAVAARCTRPPRGSRPAALNKLTELEQRKKAPKKNLLVTQWRLQILKEEIIPSSDLVLLFPNCEF